MKDKIISACEKCGKLQPKDEKASNKNWDVFDPKAICECGGKYTVMFESDAEELRNAGEGENP